MAEEKSLQYIYETMELNVPENKVDISEYRDVEALSEHNANERMGAALRVFIQSMLDSATSIGKINKTVIDAQIAAIDEKISAQLDEILHNEQYQKLESAWSGLKFQVDRTNFKKNVKIELLNVSKQDLLEDFEDSPETIQSGLYKHIYTSEYDTPGGEPFTTIISNYEFDASAQDISLLQDVSRVAASAHCPFIGSVGNNFLLKGDIRELPQIEDLENYMDRAEYLKWKSFRESEDARYVGLVLRNGRRRVFDQNRQVRHHERVWVVSRPGRSRYQRHGRSRWHNPRDDPTRGLGYQQSARPYVLLGEHLIQGPPPRFHPGHGLARDGTIRVVR